METKYLYTDGVFKDPLAKEEEKGPEKKREQKAKGKFDDGKSDISRFTNKTNSGALKRHCECGKLVTNWWKHKKDFHGGLEAFFMNCVPDCSKCQGKFITQFLLPGWAGPTPWATYSRAARTYSRAARTYSRAARTYSRAARTYSRAAKVPHLLQLDVF
jgi:hypothetical protein